MLPSAAATELWNVDATFGRSPCRDLGNHGASYGSYVTCSWLRHLLPAAVTAVWLPRCGNMGMVTVTCLRLRNRVMVTWLLRRLFALPCLPACRCCHACLPWLRTHRASPLRYPQLQTAKPTPTLAALPPYVYVGVCAIQLGIWSVGRLQRVGKAGAALAR